MDVLAIKPRTIEIELTHPGTGAPTGVFIACASGFSDEVASEMFRIRDAALAANFFEMSSAEKDEQAKKMLAAQIVGWRFEKGATLGGVQDPLCSAENKLKLLSNRIMRAQIEAKIAADAAFFDGPESVSPTLSGSPSASTRRSKTGK